MTPDLSALESVVAACREPSRAMGLTGLDVNALGRWEGWEGEEVHAGHVLAFDGHADAFLAWVRAGGNVEKPGSRGTTVFHALADGKAARPFFDRLAPWCPEPSELLEAPATGLRALTRAARRGAAGHPALAALLAWGALPTPVLREGEQNTPMHERILASASSGVGQNPEPWLQALVDLDERELFEDLAIMEAFGGRWDAPDGHGVTVLSLLASRWPSQAAGVRRRLLEEAWGAVEEEGRSKRL